MTEGTGWVTIPPCCRSGWGGHFWASFLVLDRTLHLTDQEIPFISFEIEAGGLCMGKIGRIFWAKVRGTEKVHMLSAFKSSGWMAAHAAFGTNAAID
jgi:hypothetical protein